MAATDVRNLNRNSGPCVLSVQGLNAKERDGRKGRNDPEVNP
jgi:hypothetical protein